MTHPSLKLKFNPGLVGAPANLTLGTTTTGAPGTDAIVTLSGTSPNYSFSFEIPRGADGEGNISGSTFTVDNALLRTDGVSTLSIQQSTVTLDDSGNMTGVLSLACSGTLTVGGIGALGSLTVGGIGVLEQGLHTIYVPAGTMVSRTTQGATLAAYETTTNKNMQRTLDFGTTTSTYAQFNIAMPKGWNPSGTLTFEPRWSQGTTTTSAAGVIWHLQALALSDTDALDAAFGTTQISADIGGTANIQYVGPVSPTITPAGAATLSDTLNFQIFRTYGTASGSSTDNLVWPARLHGVKILFALNAPTDA